MSALPQSEKQKFSLGEAVRLVVGYAVGLFLLYAFLIQPFYIPSGSMKSTLLVGDRLIVTKFSYGYSQYSLPFQPLSFSGRYFATPPERGDIVVFRAELDDADSDFVKRIVGLPGDSIQMVNGVLHINGQAVKREAVPDYVGEDACAGGATTVVTRVKQWRETLPNGVSYNTLDCMPDGPLDSTPPVIITPSQNQFDNSIVMPRERSVFSSTSCVQPSSQLNVASRRFSARILVLTVVDTSRSSAWPSSS